MLHENEEKEYESKGCEIQKSNRRQVTLPVVCVIHVHNEFERGRQKEERRGGGPYHFSETSNRTWGNVTILHTMTVLTTKKMKEIVDKGMKTLGVVARKIGNTAKTGARVVVSSEVAIATAAASTEAAR
jgi:hypothetical protein